MPMSICLEQSNRSNKTLVKLFGKFKIYKKKNISNKTDSEEQ